MKYGPLQWPGWPQELPSACRCLLQPGCPAASSGPTDPELQPRMSSHSLTELTGDRGNDRNNVIRRYRENHLHLKLNIKFHFTDVFFRLWRVTVPLVAAAGVLIILASPQAKCQLRAEVANLVGGSGKPKLPREQLICSKVRTQE